MQPNGSDSYLEQCIAALPPQKQEAAWRAFREISETGDDSYLSKLLTVLEANGAYAKEIPKDLVAASDKLVRDMTGVIDRLGHEENRREAWVKNAMAAEFQRLGQSLPVGQILAGIANQNQLLERLRQTSSQLKGGANDGWNALVTVIIFAIGISVPAWFFWGGYREGRQAKALADAGIQIQITKTDAGNRLTVIGPQASAGAWRRDATEAIYGVEIDFSRPR
jgi:hypothetical protein